MDRMPGITAELLDLGVAAKLVSSGQPDDCEMYLSLDIEACHYSRSWRDGRQLEIDYDVEVFRRAWDRTSRCLQQVGAQGRQVALSYELTS